MSQFSFFGNGELLKNSRDNENSGKTAKYIMINITKNQIAGLIPITILLHQSEEYFGNFPDWYSNLFNAQLSNQDFILINGIGLIIFTIFALSYVINGNNIILVALGTLIIANGMIHLLLSIFTLSYSPGTASAVVFFIPVGIHIYKKILPQLNLGERVFAISIGVITLLTVSFIARNI